jgi:hypothetical protein
MYIKSLEKMESIVASNKSLSWSGWDVVNSYPSDKARTSKYGKYLNGKWHMTKTFKPGPNGWDIPDRMISNEQRP